MAWLQETKSSFQKTMLLQYVSIILPQTQSIGKTRRVIAFLSS